jgi:nucleotidyltransferase substrate binding protein (TIGR01987 family)
MEDIRYKQRFENFKKVFFLLKDSLKIENPSIIEKAGIIQFFEIGFELAWKLMKDYLEFEGYSVKSPREAIKTAFSIDLIDNGSIWLEALGDRNLTVHTYNESDADEIYEKIKNEYFKLLENLYKKFECMD